MTYLWNVLVCVLIFAVGPPLSASAQSTIRIKITEYGIYTVDNTDSQRNSAGILNGTVTNEHRTVTTTKVPAKLGVNFGFRYRIVGGPKERSVTLKKVVVYPPAGVQPPQSSTPLQRDERTLMRSIGETFYAGYGFDDPWELVPGTWIIQLWQADHKLAEKQFAVVAP